MTAQDPVVADHKEGEEPAGAWAQSARLAFRFLFLAVCLAALGWSVSNFRQVPPESRALVFRFGQLVRQQGSGLLMAWPQPIERLVILPSEDRQLEFRIDQFEPDSSVGTDFMISDYARENSAFLLTGDASVVHLQASLLYQITDPAAYVLAAEHVGPALQRIFVASAVAVAASRDIDTILVARPELDAAANAASRASREQLRADLMNAMNRRLDDLANIGTGASLGVKVSRVDLAAAIPSGAKSAFDYVLIATQQADRDIAEARTGAAMTALRANQDRDRTLTDADARAEEKVTEARSRTASVAALAKGSPGLTGEMLESRIYYDRIGPLLAKAARVDTVDSNGGISLMLPGPVPR
jgi:regulator of protease activity HflC (stomatin/prohibitin superfamily)